MIVTRTKTTKINPKSYLGFTLTYHLCRLVSHNEEFFPKRIHITSIILPLFPVLKNSFNRLLQHCRRIIMGGVLSVVSYFSSRTFEHLLGYFHKSFTFSSKSKAQLLLEYNDLNAVSAKYFYIQLLSEIKNAVLSDDVDMFKTLNSLLNYVIASKSSEVMQKYEQTALESVGKINLITLACKAAAGKILEYLLSNQNVNCLLPFRTDRSDLSPEEEDDESHNAFYYAIRSNVTSLLEILIYKWPNSYFKDTQELDDVLSKAFNELLVRNVPLKKDMELYVKKKLVDIRFFNDSSSKEKPPNNPKNLLMLRIEYVLEKIAFIVTNYWDDKNELDEQFLFISKYVAKNIHTLKSQLNFTYDRLPWEEMEFCLIVFIRFCFKAFRVGPWYIFHSESFYLAILNKQRLLSHLKKFSNSLECVKEELKTIDISKVPNNNKNIIRKEVIEKEKNKLFEDLYNDFTQMRDLFTLVKIKKYAEIALSVDPRNKEGHILITRALQVMGEHFNRQRSSKLSDATADFLLSMLPNNLADIITNLRNSLSHLEAFCLRCETEENANTLFVNIQADIAKIGTVILDILNRKTLVVMLTMLSLETNPENVDSKKKIVEQNDFSVSLLTNVLGKAKNINIQEILQLEKLVLNAEVELDKEINYSKQMFRRLHDVIDARSPEIPQQSSLPSDAKELRKFLSRVLSNADSTSLLTENEHFVTDGKIDIDKVTEIMEDVFIKNGLTKNKAMLNRIKKQDTASTWKLFPQCDDLLQELPDEMKMADKAKKIKMAKLISDVEAVIESKSRSEKERFRRILSMIAEKKLKLKSFQEEMIYLSNERNSRMENMVDGYFYHSMIKEDIYKFQNATDPLWEQMDLKSFIHEFHPILAARMNKLEYDAGDNSLMKALLDIYYFVFNIVGNIKWIKEFRNMIHSHKKVKPYTFAKNVYTLKPDFAQQLPLKISLLKSVLKNHNLESLSGKKLQACEKNLKFQTLIEMLVLDILSVIEGLKNQMTHINFYLDSYYPTAYGRNLRNHLAHDNILVDMLLEENFTNILLNAQKIIEVEDILQEELGKKVENDPEKSRKSHDMDLSIIEKQRQFFVSLVKGIDKKRVKDFMSEGVDIYGRDVKSCTALHFAARALNTEILKFLLTFNLDINAEDDSRQTVLHVAAISGNERTVKYLIEERKMPVDGKNIYGETPLHLASITGHKGVVRRLLKHKANKLIKNEYGYAPLHYAVLYNHLNVVSVLLENETHVDANQTFYGFTALHLAAAKGHLKLVDSLLEKKANVNFKSDMDFVPLHYAAKGGHFEVVKSLIKNGADVNAKTVQGLTPLHSAAHFGDAPTIDILLQHGAEVNATYINGSAPLHFAVGNGCFAASKLLMEKGADIARPSGDGTIPLYIAASLNHCELFEALLNGADTNSKIQALQTAACKGNLAIVELLFDSGMDIKLLLASAALRLAAEEGQTDIVKFLLDRGADINAQNGNADTALHLSSSKVRKEVVQLLIERKADILIKNNTGTFPLEIIVRNGMTDFLIKEEVVIDFSHANDVSPFHFGAFYGDVNFINYCIQKGCPVDIRTKSGSTALLLATLGGRVEAVSFLLDNGSDINAEDEKGCTALEHAVNSNNKTILELLIKNRANLSATKERTLFLSSVTQGHEDIVDFFLSRNPNILAACSKNDEYSLHRAVRLGHVSVVKKILEKGKKDELNVIDETPLLVAVKMNQCEIAYLLLSKGADPDVSSKYGELPLLLAIEKGSSKMVEILLKFGADYLIKDAKGKTSIELAIETRRSDIVELLLEKPDIHNINGQKDSSLLHVAASSGSLEIIKSLTDKKADINSKDSSGAKPIHIAAKEGYRDVLEYFLNLGVAVDERGENDWTLMHYAAAGNHSEIFKFLSERGADVNAVDVDGATPLHVAAEAGNLEALLALLEIGAFYDARNKNNKTPLKVTKLWNTCVKISLLFASNMFSAVKSDNRFKLEGILSTGLDVLKFNFVNVKNAENTAPIHYAVWKGYERVVNILLKYNANLNLRSKNGWTSLHYAAKFSHLGIVQDLLRNGAVFEAMSDSGKSPLHYSTDRDVVAILEFLKNIFRKIENKDCSSLQDLKAIEDMDVAKAVLRAKNLQAGTLTAVAIVNDHPDIDELNEIFQAEVFIPLKMAEMFYRHENYEKSFKLYEAVLQKRINIFNQDDPAVLDIQERLASLLVRLRDYNRALSLAQKVYETLRSTVGDRKRETLRVKCLIAIALENTGQVQQALNIYEEVSGKQREVLGLNHRETLETLHRMAELLYKENKLEMALKVNEEIFKTLTEYYEISPWTFRILTNIAIILREQKKYYESQKLLRIIFEAKGNIFGWDHQETMATTTEFAATVIFIGEKERALILLRKNEYLQFKLLEPNHLDTLRTRSIIAEILFSQKKVREALAIYTEDLSALILKLGANHPSIKKIRERMDFINSCLKNHVF
ncbi:Ankyrin-3 [Araneus ventricosus]|uniref:Alpha-latrotoxin n=1 Tax=Araneus ventricosus TaxID=182803 RepID=A0A4Y2HFB8_ARAVE|nr:Ankyrin-3 [Araneus ventricosus]